MKPVDFPEKNFTFTKPSSMTDDQCGSLPVFKGQDANKVPVIISCWELTKDEMDEVAKTGKVYLQIFGNGMPPVYVGAENPFPKS